MLPQNKIGKATKVTVRHHNESLILRTIYAQEAISRADIARVTNLSRPTVTELTQHLIDTGLVQEIGLAQDHKVGKPPTLLAFNPDVYHLIAVDIGGTKGLVAVMNLRGEIIHQEKQRIYYHSTQDSLNQLQNLIATMVERATRPLLGIGIGSPGIIDSEAGVVQFASNLGWEDVPLAKIIGDRFGLPVHIGTDTKVAALGEYRFGQGQNHEDVIVVMLGTGIGAGIIVNGNLVTGKNNVAGEIGHSPIPGLNTICNCGSYGCLETVSSGWGLAKQAQHIITEYPDSALAQLAQDQEVNAKMLEEAAKYGNNDAIQLIKNAGYYLGIVLSHLAHILNPSKIILSGSLTQFGEPFVGHIRQSVKEHALEIVADHLEIVVSELNDRIIPLGAAALLLENELRLWQG